MIDHSVQVDAFGNARAFDINADRDYERNRERYAFLRWGQQAFDNFRVVPPATGICHQVNLEYLGQVVFRHERDGVTQAYPDTLVGTDSHTTMINGLGVLGWGVGGIEAEAAMLGQPISMLLPQVVGFKLSGELPEGATATDLVLTVTEMLRERGVVGKFVEFFGPGLHTLGLADRATIGNMSPEFGSTCAIFPVDRETLRYLEFTGRPTELIELVDAYSREQGIFHDEDSEEPTFSETLELDLGDVEPSIAGPKRPQDRIALADAKARLPRVAGGVRPGAPPRRSATAATTPIEESFPASDPPGEDHDGEAGKPARSSRARGREPGRDRRARGRAGRRSSSRTATEVELDHGRVVIAAITSCTNTSNPSVMIGAGLLAKKAVERGLERPALGEDLAGARLDRRHRLPRSARASTSTSTSSASTSSATAARPASATPGPLPEEISEAVNEKDLVVCAVLSGNRNFEGRINPDVRNNYLASPPLCVAYALAGRMDIDLLNEPIGEDSDGERRSTSPTSGRARRRSSETVADAVRQEMFEKTYADVFDGDERWRELETPEGDRYTWPDSTYVRKPSFFEGMDAEPQPVEPIEGARVLAVLGDSVTTDHISPAGAIKKDSPAGKWLIENGVEPRDFNSYGSRRGNHEVMIRGTFANVRLRNKLVDREGGFTRKFPDGEEMTIYDAAMAYAEEDVPLVVLAGKEYGSGSSRDWAAKGTALLGVRAVIAESFERIHRSNLIGMGVLPLQFPDGESAESLGLTGEETFDVGDLENGEAKTRRGHREPATAATRSSSRRTVRLDTPNEVKYFQHGGILHRVLRELRG